MRLLYSGTIAVALLLPVAARAQNGAPGINEELAAAHLSIATHLQAAAEMMPENSYSFRPTPEVRSFGQIIAHVAGGQFLYCSQGGGGRLEPDLVKKLNDVRPFSDVGTASSARTYTKTELVSLLAASTEFCRVTYSSVGAIAPKALRALIGNIAHDNEHYGNLVTYLRSNGLTPPSTATAKDQRR